MFVTLDIKGRFTFTEKVTRGKKSIICSQHMCLNQQLAGRTLKRVHRAAFTSVIPADVPFGPVRK